MTGMLKLKNGSEKLRAGTDSISSEYEGSFSLPIKLIICLVAGFVLADSVIGGARSPLVISFVGTLSLFPSIAGFAGAMISFLVLGTLSDSVTTMIAMLVIIFSNFIVVDIMKKKPSSIARCITTGVACFLSEIVISISMELNSVLILAMVCRALLCALATYFADRTISSAKGNPRMFLNGDNAISVAVVYVLLVATMSNISFGMINIGRIFGMTLILVTAFKSGFRGSSVVSILTSFGIVLASTVLGRDTMLLAFAGLVCGLFVSGGKISTASVFVVANILGIVLLGLLSGSERFACDVVIATVLFFIIPEKWYSAFFIGIGRKQPAVSQLLEQRIDFVRKTFKDVRQSTDKAGIAFERRTEAEDISAEVCSKVCSVCRDSMFCCESDLHRVVTYFASVEAILSEKGYIVEKDLPKGLIHCAKKEKLVTTFNNAYKQLQMDRRTGDTYSFLREMSLEQMITTEDMLKSINEGMTELAGCDDIRTTKARNILVAYGAKFPVVSVMQDGEGRLFVEAYIKGMIKGDMSVVKNKISDVFEREFSQPVINCIEKVTKICFYESPVFDIDIGACKKTGSERTSGDTQIYFNDGKGRFYFIISDGMGSGARAAVESCMTVTLLKKLLLSGVGYDCAFRIINLILLTKSPDEMFATIDLMCINCYTGQADILKLGAAQTFLKTNGIIKCIESYSTPVGIINTIEFEHRTTFLNDGDCAVMLSDGIEEENFALIKECMADKNVSASKSATRIIENCSDDAGKKVDDKSIFVLKISKI